MKLTPKLLFASVFVLMAVVNIRAAMAMNILASFPLFGANPWAVATLYDAYCGFLTFYMWVAYKERTLSPRVAWFVLVVGLRNLAMSIYMLKELRRLKPAEPAWAVRQRRAA